MYMYQEHGYCVTFETQQALEKYVREVVNPSLLEKVRTERNRHLKNSDWTQLSDTPLSIEKRQAWATYRQALRDLPSNTTDPTNPIWPSAPDAPAETTKGSTL